MTRPPRRRDGAVARSVLLVVALAAAGACGSTENAAEGADGSAQPAGDGGAPAAAAATPGGATPSGEVPEALPSLAETPASPDTGSVLQPTPPPNERIESTWIRPAVDLQLEETWTHGPSGVAFPAAAAGFLRTTARRFDREGNNIGISYRRDDGGFPLVVSIYVYPAPFHDDGTPVPFDEQFVEEQAAVRAEKEDVVLRRSAGSALSAEGILGGRSLVVRSEEYGFTMGSGAEYARVATVLTSIRMDPWRIKYRVTLPEDCADDGFPWMEDLFAALRLPPTGLGEAKPVLEEGR